MTIDGATAALVRRALAVLGAALTLAACAPEVGSERWCQAMRDKPRLEWTGNEALEYAKSCVID